MNLLQIRQKMFELAISDAAMADLCGVSVAYLKNSLSAGCKSAQITKKLQQKIEGVFHTLEVKAAKEKRAQEKETLVKEQPCPKIEATKEIPAPQNPMITFAEQMYKLYGMSMHNSVFFLNDLKVEIKIVFSKEETTEQ